MAEWIDGYGIDKDGKVTYKSIDCPFCDGVVKFHTFEERDHAKEIFKFCPICGEKVGVCEDG
jgi:ribosomal protein S27AE